MPKSHTAPDLLYCLCEGEDGKPRVISRMPVMAFQWASDSRSLWVIGLNAADRLLAD